jgi:hypothetical protein
MSLPISQRNTHQKMLLADMPTPTTKITNGHAADKLDERPHVPAKAGSKEDEQLVINTIRCLGADLCQQVSRRACIYRRQLTPSSRAATRVP